MHGLVKEDDDRDGMGMMGWRGLVVWRYTVGGVAY